MRDARVGERLKDMAHQLQDRLLEYGADHLRLLLQVMRELAHGRPLSAEWVDQRIAELGLSLQDHPHRLSVAGVPLSAWCAEDTLFLPAIVQQTATIESPSPVTGQPIRLRVSPERVEEISPPSAVVSLVLVDPSREHLASVEAIWSAFCRHIHFFASRDEAERWATGTGRNDMAILSVEEGFAWQRPVWAEVLRAAA